ncbi:interleukin-21 [Acanthochromis polyacanthus]|uniref:interleukin-21 n=1 Tax=Acanthochromis polyacanthus TaxID=80966 RepID=UPI00223409DD|nr:interleukin-21 [Acanthochromis polyacanthus]
MKLVVLCLLAVCCCSLADTDVKQTRRKLQEVLLRLTDVKESLQSSEQELRTPPKNIEDCCCRSALQCFRTNLNGGINAIEKRKQRQLYISLRDPAIVEGLDFCNAGNATVSQSTCQDCGSHPKEKASEFFSRLESLIERAIAKLTMD